MNQTFIDTNILAYLIDPSDDKYLIAKGVVQRGGVISVQVLNEYCSVARRKARQSWMDISKACNGFLVAFEVCDVTKDTQTLARTYADRYGYAIYDANILASAKLAGCDTLLCEDMRHGQVIEGVRITNPFIAES